MKPLRIVLVMIEPPSPFGNAAGRGFYVLMNGLIDRGHRVTAFATSSSTSDAADAARRFPSPDFDLRIFPEPPPDRRFLSRLNTLRRPYSYMFSPEMRQAVRDELARGFDVLHLEQVWSGWLGLKHANRAVLNVHYLVEIDLAGSGGGFRSASVRRAERSILRRFPTITTLTPRLTERVEALIRFPGFVFVGSAVRTSSIGPKIMVRTADPTHFISRFGMSPRADVRTVPLGLDTSLYPFGTDPTPRPPTVTLIGSFGWRPTFLAGQRLVTRLWPEIVRQVPGARLRLVGRRAVAEMGPIVGDPGIEIFEDVPDTMPYFRSADVLLYPTPQGSGMKVKVMEAFAIGTPVVATAEGFEGLPVRDGIEAGSAEDDAGLIDRTVALLRDPSLRDRYRINARTMIERHCGPGAVLDRVEAIHAEVADRSGRG